MRFVLLVGFGLPMAAGCGTITAPAAQPTQVASELRPTPTAPACPDAGYAISLGPADAAMGLRALPLHLHNCGKRTIDLNGYPTLTFYDADGRKVTTRVQHSSKGITASAGAEFDAPPAPVALKPHEWAQAVLLWRNTTELSEDGPVTVDLLAVAATPGARPQSVPDAHVDLGTTGVLGVSAWRLLSVRR